MANGNKYVVSHRAIDREISAILALKINCSILDDYNSYFSRPNFIEIDDRG